MHKINLLCFVLYVTLNIGFIFFILKLKFGTIFEIIC